MFKEWLSSEGHFVILSQASGRFVYNNSSCPAGGRRTCRRLRAIAHGCLYCTPQLNKRCLHKGILVARSV